VEKKMFWNESVKKKFHAEKRSARETFPVSLSDKFQRTFMRQKITVEKINFSKQKIARLFSALNVRTNKESLNLEQL